MGVAGAELSAAMKSEGVTWGQGRGDAPPSKLFEFLMLTSLAPVGAQARFARTPHPSGARAPVLRTFGAHAPAGTAVALRTIALPVSPPKNFVLLMLLPPHLAPPVLELRSHGTSFLPVLQLRSTGTSHLRPAALPNGDKRRFGRNGVGAPKVRLPVEIRARDLRCPKMWPEEHEHRKYELIFLNPRSNIPPKIPPRAYAFCNRKTGCEPLTPRSPPGRPRCSLPARAARPGSTSCARWSA